MYGVILLVWLHLKAGRCHTVTSTLQTDLYMYMFGLLFLLSLFLLYIFASVLYTFCLCTCTRHSVINPRRACAARVTVCHSVRLSVCYHVFCHYAQQGGQKAIPTGSVPHWLDFKNGDFRKSTAFKSYGLKTKRTSQYANEHDPDSARFRALWRQYT